MRTQSGAVLPLGAARLTRRALGQSNPKPLIKEEITAMRREAITALFDKQASSYDQQWSKMAPINGASHLLTSTVLSELPAQAHILCVGAGTGAEILYLAQKFPQWHFTAVEPSTAMLDVFRRRAEEHGISSRCV